MSASTSLCTEERSLDFPLNNISVLVYFPVSDPGFEYEIVLGKYIESPKICLEKGGNVVIKYGKARAQGVLVEKSDDLSYLENNFRQLVAMHQESIKEEAEDLSPKKRVQQCIEYNSPTSPHNNLDKSFLKSSPISTVEQGTQTDQSVESIEADCTKLMKKYRKIKLKYQTVQMLLSDIQGNMEDSISKVKKFKGGKRDACASTSKYYEEDKENDPSSSKSISIGSHGTKLPKVLYDNINWGNYRAATRKLLTALFPRKVLATHSLSGKPSPAFLNSGKKTKARLDPRIISDIVEVVTKKSKVVESLVRGAVTTKCADENKLYRKRIQQGSTE